MKTMTILALGAGLTTAVAAAGAQAMPVGPAASAAPLVEHVADGCGPGSFRGPRGFCRPVGGPRFYGPGPRRFYGGGPRRFYGRPGFYGPRPYGY